MFNQTREYLSSKNGSVLLVTMLILFAVSVIGAFLSSVSTTDLKISGNQRTHAQALSVAEAGLTEVIHRMSLPNPTNVTVGAWTGNASIYDSSPYDPEWVTRVFLASPGVVPAGAGSVFNTGTVQDPDADYLPYSEPAGMDGVIEVRHKWVDRNGDTVRDANEIVRYDPAIVPPENFTSGFPIDVITLTGRSGSSRRTIEAEVTKTMLTPKTLGAIFSNTRFRARKSYGFCGYNHDATIPSWLTPPACFPYHLGPGNLPGVTNTGERTRFEDGGEIVGVPVPVDSDPTHPWYGLSQALGLTDAETAALLANADHTSLANPMNGITYIQGDVRVQTPITGSGLLYVTGDLDIRDTFEYRGLIYVTEHLQEAQEPTWILGALILDGSMDSGWHGWPFDDGTGNSGVLYSMDAIRLALSQYLPMQTLSWTEK